MSTPTDRRDAFAYDKSPLRLRVKVRVEVEEEEEGAVVGD